MAASTYPGTTRKPIFIEDDDDLASLSDLEAGFSGYHHSLFTKSSSFNALKRRGSYRVLPSSTASLKIYAARYEDNHQPHFLEACSLCKKPLGDNRDIFMYRGDTPFCSEECRQEQIEIDEVKEKKWNLYASMKPLRVDHNKSTPNKNQNYPVRTGTVAVS